MADIIAATNGNGRAQGSDRSEIKRSQDRDLWLQHLKTAMTDTGWTVDSLAAHYAIDRSYVSRMLDGEKPFTVDRMLELPDELEARLEAIRAEHFGLIVVAPLTGLAAQKAFVAGLIGIMSQPPPALPDRATQMAKAAIGEKTKAKTA